MTADIKFEPLEPAREPGYHVVRNLIRGWDTDAYVNSKIWRAVEAFGDAMNVPSVLPEVVSAPPQTIDRDALIAERDALGEAAFAAYVATGGDTDGASTWQEFFRPITRPSWAELLKAAVEEEVDSSYGAANDAIIALARRTRRFEVAEARIDAVRALHVEERDLSNVAWMGTCEACRWPFPCPTVRALDGTQ